MTREPGFVRAGAQVVPSDVRMERRKKLEDELEALEARLRQLDLNAAEAKEAADKVRADANLKVRVGDFDRPIPFLIVPAPTTQVTATLAVEVTFPTAERDKFAAAGVDLAREATTVADRVSVAEWDAALRGCHVLVRFTPRRLQVSVEGEADLVLTALLVPLPLTRDPGGFVLARDGDRVVRFTKYPHDACVRFQEGLATAVPAAR